MTEVKSLPNIAQLSARDRKSANKQIDYLLKQFRPKRIIDLLPVIKLRFSETVLAVALSRVERKKDDLPMDDQVFFEGFKRSLN